jgi:hypothetical protein
MSQGNPNPPPLPPPPRDNKIAVRHGMHSEPLVNLRADELRPRVIDAAPWTADPAFSGTLELYCRALATALMGLEYIAQVTAEKGYGKVAPRTIETCNGMLNSAARLGSLLGLDPKAKATIMALSASTESSLASLDRLAETGARAISNRKAELELLKGEQEQDKQQ